MFAIDYTTDLVPAFIQSTAFYGNCSHKCAIQLRSAIWLTMEDNSSATKYWS